MNQSKRFKKHIRESSPYIGGTTRSREEGKEKIFKLSSNENLLGPSPLAVRAIEKAIPQIFEYNYQDDLLLRNAISSSSDSRIDPDQVVTANSGMELIDMICRAFVEPGDECILSSPTFLAYKNFANLSGARMKDVPLKERDFMLDVEGILNAVSEKTRIIFISSPNNPTGSIVTKSEMEKLMRGLNNRCVVIYDEVYHHYVSDRAYARALDFINEGYPLIGLHSFSKAYGLAGIRLGYCFSIPEIADYLSKLRRPFMINTLSMEAGIIALSDHEHIERTVELVEREKSWLYKELRSFGIKFWPGHANFILMESPYRCADFEADMLQGGVMIRTAEVFGAPGKIRLTVGTRQANAAFINLLKILI